MQAKQPDAAACTVSTVTCAASQRASADLYRSWLQCRALNDAVAPGRAQAAAQLQRGFYRVNEQGRPEQQPPSEWTATVDDELPTLAEVFARVPQHVGFDIEVRSTGAGHLASRGREHGALITGDCLLHGMHGLCICAATTCTACCSSRPCGRTPLPALCLRQP